MRKLLFGLASLLLSGCMGMPQNIAPVQDFELDSYLGEWFEIARLDHSFERGLDHVTANYSLRDDGGVTVTNRGFSIEKKAWKEAEGRAFFVNDQDEGFFKVSFFGPFYSSYVIFDLDKENYQYAFVSGYNTSYLWLLSRTPTVDEDIKAKFITRAQEAGFDIDKLIFVEHQ